MDKIRQLVKILEKDHPEIYDAYVIDEILFAVIEAETREDVKRHQEFNMETPAGNKAALSVALTIFDHVQELEDWEIEELMEEIFYD